MVMGPKCRPPTPSVLVLDFGWSRTGTTTTRIALEQLGYPTYDNVSCTQFRDFEFWERAFDAEKAGRPFCRADFEPYLNGRGFTAVADLPTLAVWRSILAAYPEAKVLLHTRDVESWFKSVAAMRETSVQTHANPMIEELVMMPMRRFTDKVRWVNIDAEDFEPRMKAAFLKHYEDVRAGVPAQQLAEYPLSEGWEPVVRHLGKKIPIDESGNQKPWPKSNAIGTIKKAYTAAPSKTLPAAGLRVLDFGWVRTGTTSTRIALEQMGYPTYDDLTCSQYGDFDFWSRAVDAERAGKPFGRAEFDPYLTGRGYTATANLPTLAVWRSLLAAYPEAKVLLHGRDADTWYKSLETARQDSKRQEETMVTSPTSPTAASPTIQELRTALPNHPNPMLEALRHALIMGSRRKFSKKIQTVLEGSEGYEERVKARFLKHYEDVRAAVPSERMIEYKVEEGWDPLVGFLGKEAPVDVHGNRRPWPHSNQIGSVSGLVMACP